MKKNNKPLDNKELKKTRKKEFDKSYQKIENFINPKTFFSIGSTCLDLAMSDSLCGPVAGTVINIIGDEATGKTLLVLTALAEAVNTPRMVKGYSFYYDEPESALNFNLARFFGSKIKKINLKPKSRTVQDFHNNVLKAVKGKKSVFYVLDSVDSLTTEDNLKDEEAPTKGGWKTEKAIVFNDTFPKIVGKMEENGSFLFLVSQTRTNIGVKFGEKKKRGGGGSSIGFYSSHVMWIRLKSRIKKKVRGIEQEIGQELRCKVRKNKITGKIREVPVFAYYDYGIDDIRGNIEWLIENRFWRRNKEGLIDCKDILFEGVKKKKKSGKETKEEGWLSLKNIISSIEEENMETDLVNIIKDCWIIVEEEISENRKPRVYGRAK